MDASARELVFEDLQGVVDDVESLRAGGYASLGQWNLAQTCAHLSDWMSFPVSGYPQPPLLVRPLVWVYRVRRGRQQLEAILRGEPLPAGSRTVPSTVHPASLDEQAAVARLRESVDRFVSHDGPLHPSTLFGELDRETHLRLQLGHCGHHLRLLVPSA